MNIEEKESPRKFDLAHFTLRDMTECGIAIRQAGVNAKNMEEVADRITRYLYENLIDGQTGQKACALVRLFKTHSYEDVGKELQKFAKALMPDQQIGPQTKCLVLLSTVGEKSEWNSRYLSGGHKAIPLASEEVVNKIPMIRNLIKQMGLEIKGVVNPDTRLLLDMAQKQFNVFYVPEALGSLYIPAQENFVVPYGIKTVLGMGGAMPEGDVFTVIMFTKILIPRELADLFKTLALNVKVALMPFEKTVFA